jgi:hypothetical protein
VPYPYWEAVVRHFSGLQKAGVVISILWFVGFGAYFWIHRHGEARRIEEAALNDCNIKYENIIEAIIPSSKGQRRDEIEAKRTECRNAIAANFSNHGEAAAREFTFIAAIDACTVALAWLIAWMFFELAV